MRILVVEDEKRIADFLCRGLEGAGYAVDAAATGAQAIDHIHATDYDLVILDLMLPDMDGLDVLEKIRNRKVGQRPSSLLTRSAVASRLPVPNLILRAGPSQI
jgi:two-component system copper resistance phosphate regulon response regulator CusR